MGMKCFCSMKYWVIPSFKLETKYLKPTIAEVLGQSSMLQLAFSWLQQADHTARQEEGCVAQQLE